MHISHARINVMITTYSLIKHCVATAAVSNLSLADLFSKIDIIYINIYDSILFIGNSILSFFYGFPSVYIPTHSLLFQFYPHTMLQFYPHTKLQFHPHTMLQFYPYFMLQFFFFTLLLFYPAAMHILLHHLKMC